MPAIRQVYFDDWPCGRTGSEILVAANAATKIENDLYFGVERMSI